MRGVLVVTDLEGIAAVDDVNALSAASPSFARARRLCTEEARVAVAALRARGVERVVIADSHRPGGDGPTLIPEALPGVEIVWQGDAFDERLLDGVDAVACIGMHASAGAGGFAAHTVSVHCAWETEEGRALSETDLLFALCAERGTPAIFVTGDDVLERGVRGPAYVCAKRGGESRPVAEVHAAIARAAAAPPVATEALPPRLVVRFKSRWQADAAERAGAERVGPHAVRVVGATFREAYARGVAAVEASGAALGAAIRTGDVAATLVDVRRSLGRRFPVGAPRAHAVEARRALAWFLAVTERGGAGSFLAADRALTLWMLEGHAPRWFAEANLAPVLAASLDALRALPAAFAADLPVAEAMARLDAIYLLAERGTPREVDAWALRQYVRGAAERGEDIWAWLLSELMAQLGWVRPVSYPPRAMRAWRVADLYWVTHLFLLETRYLRRPLPATGFETLIEELTLAAPDIVAERRVDIAAEIAVCLQLAREGDAPEVHDILELLARQQQPDGRIADPSSEREASGVEAVRLRVHATAAALLAFAGSTQPR